MSKISKLIQELPDGWDRAPYVTFEWTDDRGFVPMTSERDPFVPKHGFRGVSFAARTNTWRAEFVLKGRSYYSGSFATVEEAAEATERKRAEMGLGSWRKRSEHKYY